MRFSTHAQHLSQTGRPTTWLVCAALALSGCAGIPQAIDTVGTTPSGSPILVGRHAAGNHSDLTFSLYNGKTKTVQGQPVPYLADALFDYPAHMVAWYIDNQDKLIGDRAVGAPVEAPRSWQGDALRFFAGTDAVLRVLGLGGAASMGWGQIGLSFLFTGLSEENFYRDRGLLAQREIAGSTLTLIRTGATALPSESASLVLLSEHEALVALGTGPMPKPTKRMVRFEAPAPFTTIVDFEFPLPASTNASIPMFQGSAYVWSKIAAHAHAWPLANVTRHPLHRFQPNGRVEVIAFRDIAHHPRSDGIRSPRELYERVLRPALSDDWFVVYTDVDPSDAKRKVFVQKHSIDPVKARIVKFDIPGSPFR